MSISILLIDDDANFAQTFADRLERRGFKTDVLANSEDVMAHLEKNRYDVILLDIIMPGKDGLAIMEEIRTKYDKNSLPIIVITVIDDAANLMEAFRRGANDYINKPANFEAACARITAHVNSAQYQRELLLKTELEAVRAMIITYNHELNNPLSIALTSIELLNGDANIDKSPHLETLRRSLDRMIAVVKKIDSVRDNPSLTFQTYVGDTKMIKINKS